MSKENIHIDNYESFYLDFLEGNLDDSMRQELLTFLDLNPHLKVDFEDASLVPSHNRLSSEEKNSLRVWSDKLELTKENLELYFVAETEGLLSESQTTNLESFILKHPDISSDQKLYGFSHLKANTKEVYTEKAKLKQKETIVLWPYLSSAVAACAVLFVYLFPSQPNINEWQAAVRSRHYHSNPKMQNSVDKSSSIVQMAEISLHKPEHFNPANTTVGYDVKAELARRPLSAIEVNNLLDKITVKTIVKQAERILVVPSTTDNQDYALALKNPVAPLTKKLSDVMKTQVDYQKGTSKNEEREGFFLKIGNFEIYRNRKLLNKN